MTIKTLITFGSQMIYNFNHISESRKIDILIARLPPKLLERPGERTRVFQARLCAYEEKLGYVSLSRDCIAEKKLSYASRTESDLLAALHEFDDIKAQKVETRDNRPGDLQGLQRDHAEEAALAQEDGGLVQDGDGQNQGAEEMTEERPVGHQAQAQDGEEMEGEGIEITTKDNGKSAHDQQPLQTGAQSIGSRTRRPKTAHRRAKDQLKYREWRQRKRQQAKLDQVANSLHSRFANAD
ncbi:hypothetical protein BKA81DRAFT_436702 [Phyllosticta paracitricarpa]